MINLFMFHVKHKTLITNFKKHLIIVNIDANVSRETLCGKLYVCFFINLTKRLVKNE